MAEGLSMPHRAVAAGITVLALALLTTGQAKADPMPPGAATQLTTDVRHAWQVTRGRGVTVAVLSSGVDPHVTGLAGRVITGPDYVHLSAPDRLDGTLIAEAIAGDDPQLGNPPGALGLAPEAEILSERIVPDYGEPGARNFDDNTFTPDMLATALRYAADHGANVVYIDWVPTSSDTTSLESAVRYALAKGVVITTWAERGENPADLTWPAATPGVIAAGTVELPAPFQRPGSTTLVASNDSVLVGVPGNAINELGPGDQPVEGWGNISAAAWIAGTAALIKSAYPHLPPVLVARAIALSARYHPRGGYRTTAGFGLINPYGALREAARLTPQAAMAGSSGVPVTAHFGSARQAATSPVARRTTVRLIGFWVLIGVGAVFVIAAAVRASKQFAER